MSSIYRKAKPKTFTAKEARQMLGIALTAEAKADTSRATERQATALAKFAIQDADRLSFTAASNNFDWFIQIDLDFNRYPVKMPAPLLPLGDK